MSNLAESIMTTMDEMTERVIHLTEKELIEDASHLLAEWTLNDQCILTKSLNGQIGEVTDAMIYATMIDDEFAYGQFTLCPDAELPVDNN